MDHSLFRSEVETLLRVGPKEWAAAARSLSPEVRFIARPSALKKDGGSVVADYHAKFSPAHPAWREFSTMVRHAHQLLSSQKHAAASWPMDCDPDILGAFPAVEMLLIEQENEPDGWRSRWEVAGGKLIGGRAVALKTSGVLQRFSEYGHPFAPFDWSGALGTEDIDRNEAEKLGLLVFSESPQSKGAGCMVMMALLSGLAGIAALVGFTFVLKPN